MLKNRNDNIISSFFKATAAFWNSAAEYQIFAILGATALLVILPLFETTLNDTTEVVFNTIIFCATAAAGFLVFKLKGSQLAAFTFAAALILRLSLVFVLENSTPYTYMCNDTRFKTYPWIRHYDSVLLQADEFFYVYHAQTYKDATVCEFINSPDFTNNIYRSSFLISRLFRFFGDGFIWYRIVGAFLGAFAAAIVTLAAEKLFSRNSATVVSLLSVLAPQTAFYSVRFLKEIWIILAASLIVFGFATIIRNKKLFLATLSISAAVTILVWTRFEYSLMFLAAVPIAICFRHKSNPAARTIAVLSVVLFGTIIFIWQFNQLVNKAEGLFDKFTIMEKEPQGRLETMDRIYKSRGALRLLNIPLALLNPPPKNLHRIFTPENGLYDTVLETDVCQWWLPMPFLLIGAITIIGRRTEFLAFLLPYIIAISTSALLIGGLLPALYRYRDSLAPMAFIIVGTGIESLITEKKLWKNIIISSVYAAFIMLSVYFYLI